MKIRRFTFLIIILTFICVIVYIFRPIPFNKDFFISESITVTYLIDNKIENGTVNPNIKSITLNSGSTELQKLQQIIEKYKYHNCISTWTGKATVEDTKVYFMLSSIDKSIIISDSPYIIIDDKVYRIGYWGNATINKLIDELVDLLEIEIKVE